MFHFIKARSRAQAREEYPGAAIYVKWHKGYRAFDYASDYFAWVRQSEQVA